MPFFRFGSNVNTTDRGSFPFSFIAQFSGLAPKEKGLINPQFIEGAAFETIIPIPSGGADEEDVGAKVGVIDGAVEEAFAEVSQVLIEAARNRLVKIVNIVYQKPRMKVTELQ